MQPWGNRAPRAASYDLIIIGTGAGGGTLARALAPSGARILLLERGNVLPEEPENWSPHAVWRDLRYRTTETWIGTDGQPFRPYTHYVVGGNTKFWGSVLFRLRPSDFGEVEHPGGRSPAWPITYEDLAPFYDEAEQLYHVRGAAGLDPTEGPRAPFPHPPVPHAPNMQQVAAQLATLRLTPFPLPLGLIDPGTPGGCQLCNTCNSFPCRIRKKADAETCGVIPALAHADVELVTGAYVERVLTSPDGRVATGVEVRCEDGRHVVHAGTVVVACGAVNSAALLLRSASGAHPAGLANRSGLVGARYMAHHATMLQAFHPGRRNDDVFQKTLAVNDFYTAGTHGPLPLGQVQSQGRTHGIMAKSVVPWIPQPLYDWWVARGVDWLAMTEDLPSAQNRVRLTPTGGIHLDYTPVNGDAHRQLVQRFTRTLKDLGYPIVMTYSHRTRNTTHQCGTAVFGDDPARSVLDPYCRTHDVANLFVVDASFFPSSAAVNPGLTIAAQALRTAQHMRATGLA